MAGRQLAFIDARHAREDDIIAAIIHCIHKMNCKNTLFGIGSYSTSFIENCYVVQIT